MTTTDMQGVDDMVARLVDIEFSRTRQVEADMEKQAMWKLIGAGVGSGLLGYGLYRGIAAGNRHNWGRKKEFKEIDLSKAERPTRFWESSKPTTGLDANADAWSKRTSDWRAKYGTGIGADNVYNWWRRKEFKDINFSKAGRPTGAWNAPKPTTGLDANADAWRDRIAAWKAKYGTSMEKNSFAVLKQLAKGVGADVTTGLLGNWGVGGLLKGVGRMLGATSENVLRKGLNNAKIIKGKNIADTAAKMNDTLRKTVKAQKRIYDKADEWGRATRYITGAEGKAQGQSMLQQVGQYLASAGQKLTDVSDAAQHSYRKSLNKNFGERNLLNAALRPTIGAASVAAPIGYIAASNLQDDKTWWAKPGQYATKALQYGSLPGLTSVVGSKAGGLLEDVANQGVRDGIHLGAHATAAELANTGRLAYLMGVLDPAGLSKEVATRANAALAKHLQQPQK